MKNASEAKKEQSDLPTKILSSVNRPINFLSIHFSKQTKIDSHRTYKEISGKHSQFEKPANLDQRKGGTAKTVVYFLPFIFVFASVMSLFTSGVIRFDFNQINPTWWIMVTSELSIGPSLAILTWKIKYQRKATRSLLFQNMTSFSLELRENEIKQNAGEFKDRYSSLFKGSWKLNDSSLIDADTKYLSLIQESSNIRLTFHELTRKQNKVLSPLSENLSIELIVFIASLAVSVVTMVINMESIENISMSTVIQSFITLLISCAVGIAIGLLVADISLKKAINIAVVRYFLYSYLTDAK